MKLKSSKYYKIIASLVVIIAAFILSYCVVKKIDHIESETVVTMENATATGYEITEDEYMIAGEDAQIVFAGIDCYASNLTINLAQPAEQDMNLTVYYVKGDNTFKSGCSYEATIKAGEKSTTIEMNTKVYSIRMDVESAVGTTFTPEGISISNDRLTPLRGMNLERFKLIFIVFLFLGMHLVFPIRKMYDQLFRFRWCVAVLLLLFMVLNKYNYSSIGAYNNLVQTDEGSAYADPVFGQARLIRTDEWKVDTPDILSAQYSDYGRYNEICMATETPNLVASNLHRGYAALANPEMWLYYFADTEYAFSFQWNFILIFGFVFCFEWLLIFTEGRRGISFMGAAMMIFSSAFQWMSFIEYVWITPMFLVGVYYFWKTDKRWKRILFALLTAIAAVRFVVILYPAFQVPVGYFILIMFVWIMWKQWDNIKEFKWQDWLILAGAVVFALSILGVYIYEIKDYMEIISNTVYPGSRKTTGGGMLQNIFLYIQDIKYPTASIANATESSTYLNLFPLGMIGAVICMIKSKTWKQQWHIIAMLVLSVILTVYASVGLPGIVCKATLLSMSTSSRAVQVLAYLQIYFIVYLLSYCEKENSMHLVTAVMIAAAAATLAVYKVYGMYPDYNTKRYLLVAAIIALLIGTGVLYGKCIYYRRLVIGMLTVIVIATGIRVNPVMKGLDAIYSKPVSTAIADIVEKEPDAVWICDCSYPGMLLANGAKTIDSVNYMPNFEFWKLFEDNDSVTEDKYNRYAHFELIIGEDPTNLIVTQDDLLQMSIQYKDLEKTGATYVLTSREIQSADSVNMQNVYDENCIRIYKIQYK